VNTAFGVATDWDTQHGINVPPARLLWGIQKLGLVGEIDHYAGVFWWGQHSASQTYGSVTLTFSGSPVFSQYTSLTLGGSTLTHQNLIGDTAESIAKCFELLVNQGSTAFWAQTSGAQLTLTERSAGPYYDIAVAADTNGTQFTVSIGAQSYSQPWNFVLDSSITPVLNRAARDWHADFFAVLQAAGLAVTVSFSQELVRPPDAWVQRFADGSAVSTATGYSDLNSSQIAWGTPVQNYMAAVYIAMGTLMQTAGLPVRLQFGEVGWWFQSAARWLRFTRQTTTRRSIPMPTPTSFDPGFRAMLRQSRQRLRLPCLPLCMKCSGLWMSTTPPPRSSAATSTYRRNGSSARAAASTRSSSRR
jgi:hypothetical protein